MHYWFYFISIYNWQIIGSHRSGYRAASWVCTQTLIVYTMWDSNQQLLKISRLVLCEASLSGFLTISHLLINLYCFNLILSLFDGTGFDLKWNHCCINDWPSSNRPTDEKQQGDFRIIKKKSNHRSVGCATSRAFNTGFSFCFAAEASTRGVYGPGSFVSPGSSVALQAESKLRLQKLQRCSLCSAHRELTVIGKIVYIFNQRLSQQELINQFTPSRGVWCIRIWFAFTEIFVCESF